jgi:hypothetical protein
MSFVVSFVPITMTSSMIMIVVIASAITFSMALMVVRDVDIVVPATLYKIDWPTTSVVIAAVMAPFFRLPRRHVQIERFIYHTDWTLNYDRIRINQNRLWIRIITDINTAIKTRLADAD